MANRIFYAVQQVSIGPDALGQYQVVKGVQSVSMTTTFNLEQAFELGQLEIYENIEGVPNIEMTVNRLLDGNALLYVLASATQNSDAYSRADDINLASSNESILKLGIWDEASYSNAQNGVAPTNEVSISGAVMSSVSYTFGVDGNFTEEVSFTATDKAWGNTSCTVAAAWADDLQNGVFAGTDVPQYAGGVQRRQYFDTTGSTIPTIIPEGSSRLQSVSVSADFGREDLFQLGDKGPYAKVATFPLEVSCSIEVISSGGDQINAVSSGCTAVANCASLNQLTDQTIVIKTCDGTVLDLGAKNKLSSVSYGGGDAGGGNVTTTFDYVTYNKLSVSGSGAITV